MNVALIHSEAELSSPYPEDYEGRDTDENVGYMAETLRQLGHSVTLVDMNLDCFERLRNMKVDVAFNLCDDGFHGETWMEPHVTALLDILRIPYTGSGHTTLTVCLDKAYTKQILSHHGLPTPDFYVAENEKELEHELEYPLIVKPVREDGSIGIKSESVVEDGKALEKQIEKVVKTYRQPALVEEFVGGREFNVALLGNNEPQALPISEILFEGLEGNERIVSYNAKWLEDSVQYKATPGVCPADIPGEMAGELERISKKAYRIMGVRGYGRVDLRVGDDGPQIIEVNPNPDLGADAGFWRSAKTEGMTYGELAAKIIDYALEGKT
ncbi:MAG: ATP-grasp domain-containing protein [Candidatus Altiarchaeota archaeon]